MRILAPWNFCNVNCILIEQLKMFVLTLCFVYCM